MTFLLKRDKTNHTRSIIVGKSFNIKLTNVFKDILSPGETSSNLKFELETNVIKTPNSKQRGKKNRLYIWLLLQFKELPIRPKSNNTRGSIISFTIFASFSYTAW